MSDDGFERAHTKLRYRKEGGASVTVKQKPKDWDCPECALHNPGYRAQCGSCMTRRPKEEASETRRSSWPPGPPE